MKTFTDPFRILCPLPCGYHGRGGRCRQRLPLRLSMRRIRPTGGRASVRGIPRRQRLSLKVRTSILGALSSMAALPPPCPSRACSRKLRLARAMPRPGARIWSIRLRIMVDAIGADGAPTDHPSGDGPLVCNVAGASRRHRDVRIEPHVNRSSKRGHVCARRQLTPDSLPPERCGTWAAARPPQPQKSGPSCRFAAARTTPVFAVSLRFASVRASLIRPPRRCAPGG